MKASTLLFALLLLVGFSLDAHAQSKPANDTAAPAAAFGVMVLPLNGHPNPWQANSVLGGKSVKLVQGEKLTLTVPNYQTHWPDNIAGYEGPVIGSSIPFFEFFIPNLPNAENLYSNLRSGPLFGNSGYTAVPTFTKKDPNLKPSVPADSK